MQVENAETSETLPSESVGFGLIAAMVGQLALVSRHAGRVEGILFSLVGREGVEKDESYQWHRAQIREVMDRTLTALEYAVGALGKEQADQLLKLLEGML